MSEGELSDRLDDLLDRYEELLASGAPVDLLDLCGGDLEQARALRSLIRGLDAVERGLRAPLETPGTPEFVSWGVRLRILERLGQGGQGSVYLAFDETLKREVAVKTSHWRDGDAVLRLRKEGEIAARLNHPGIVPVFGSGLTELGVPFLVMRYVPGRTLNDFLSACRPSVEVAAAEHAARTALATLAAACSIADFAHRAGILHCDLKPQNILVGTYDETVVLDWGAAAPFEPASSTAERLQITQGSLLLENSRTLGTNEFMSPERLAGAEDLGPASDVYSLGAILDRIVRGPIRRSNGERRTSAEPESAAGFSPALRPAANSRLRRVVDWACDESPGKRPSTAAALSEELRSVLREPLARVRSRPFLLGLFQSKPQNR